MKNIVKWCYAARFMMAVVVSLTGSYVFANGFNWEGMPPELRIYTLHKLAEQGDYDSIMRAYLTSKSMEALIKNDPVLSNTLEGIRELDKHMKIIDNLLAEKSGEGVKVEEGKVYLKFGKLASMFEEIRNCVPKAATFSSSLVNVDSGTQKKVFDGIVNWLCNKLGKFMKNAVDGKYTIPEYHSLRFDVTRILGVLARSIPLECLGKLDAIRVRVFQGSPDESELQVRSEAEMLKGLASNARIPIDIVTTRLGKFIKENKGKDIFGIANSINQAILNLSERPDLNEEALKFFKENERNPIWQENNDLRQALENAKTRTEALENAKKNPEI